ncbi:MAG: putative Sco1/SenC family protein [Frankiales bacterium]|nr:putative Sco1/SenC family protein [Frankiales bacterium]
MADTGSMRLLLALVLALGLAGCGPSDGTASPTPSGSARAYHGVEPSPTPARPSYVLKDTSGKRFDFGAETKGQPTFVYFGYTNCPDECPTAMADIAAALRKAPAAVRSAVRVVFVTTDPKRDTAPVLRRWLDQFSPGFIGLLGTEAEVAEAQRATGIAPAFPDGLVPTLPGQPNEHIHKPGTAPHKHFGPLGYAVTHSAVIFAYDADDRLPVVYPGGVTPSDIAADLPALAHP